MPKRQAILHIGTPKTGTTSIQQSMMDWNVRLRTQGFHYAQSPGKRNHVGLVAYARSEDHASDSNFMRRAGGDGATIRARLERSLVGEMEALPEHVRTVLFSSEQLSTRLDGPVSLGRLQGLLAPLFDRIRVVVYLRRQDEFAVSRYSTSLRAGGETGFSLLPSAGTREGIYDHSIVIDRFAEVFGAAAITPRIFERKALAEGDVVHDFLQVCGIDPAGLDLDARQTNPALRAEVQEFVRRFNALAEERQVVERPRLGPLLRDSRFLGKARLPLRSAARDFYDRFAASNEQVRAAYFPERTTLFTEDFSRYPEVEDADAYADDKVLNVALDVLLTVAGELRAAQVDAEYVRGQQAEAAGRLDVARLNYTAALRGDNRHERARKALSRVEAAEAANPAGIQDEPRRRRRPSANDDRRPPGELAVNGVASGRDDQPEPTGGALHRAQRRGTKAAPPAAARRADRRATRKAERATGAVRMPVD